VDEVLAAKPGWSLERVDLHNRAWKAVLLRQARFISFQESMAHSWAPPGTVDLGRYMPLIYTRCSLASIVAHAQKHWVIEEAEKRASHFGLAFFGPISHVRGVPQMWFNPRRE